MNNETFFRAVAPKYQGVRAVRQAEIIRAIAPAYFETLGDYRIDSDLRITHFTAQIAHECAGFSTTEEFASGSAYEGRADLGNVKPGDGRRYKGRGLIQLTGRANYRRIGARLKLDLEADPALAADPLTSLKIACEYWTSRNINTAADINDLERVTRLVNGGLNGLDDRRLYFARARAALQARSAERQAMIAQGVAAGVVAAAAVARDTSEAK